MLEHEFEVDIHPIFADIEDDAVLQPEEIAKMLCMSPESVRRWCRQGKLASYNFGGKYIIVGDDFKRYMKQSRKKSIGERTFFH
jgi:excisionase family DNA binding protein